MTSLSYGRVFCLESQKIDGTEYLRGPTDFAIFLFFFLLLLNLKPEIWPAYIKLKINNIFLM